jgi:hypothetical protein
MTIRRHYTGVCGKCGNATLHCETIEITAEPTAGRFDRMYEAISRALPGTIFDRLFAWLFTPTRKEPHTDGPPSQKETGDHR